MNEVSKRWLLKVIGTILMSGMNYILMKLQIFSINILHWKFFLIFKTDRYKGSRYFIRDDFYHFEHRHIYYFICQWFWAMLRAVGARFPVPSFHDCHCAFAYVRIDYLYQVPTAGCLLWSIRNSRKRHFIQFVFCVARA